MPEELVYLNDDQPGLKRVRKGKGFCYYNDAGQKICDESILNRIKSLGIPPVWKEVWIAKDENGHLQATGLDPKNRKQYLYHSLWNEFRNEAKFLKMKEFGLALPTIRRITDEHIHKRGWPKEKVLALVVQILDEHHIRIGNEFYKEQNETFGLTTLRRKHFEFVKGVGHLAYKAKSGKYRSIDISNGHLARLIKKSSELPGYEIFKYRDENKKYQAVNSHDVNEYLRAIAGEKFTCKDFRTWGGTRLTIEVFEEALAEVESNPRLNLKTTIIKKVAEKLGNTVSICRDYYMHPKVLEVVIEGNIDRYKKKKIRQLSSEDLALLHESEIAVLNII